MLTYLHFFALQSKLLLRKKWARCQGFINLKVNLKAVYSLLDSLVLPINILTEYYIFNFRGKNQCNILSVAHKIYLSIYQLFWTQACPEGMGTNGIQVPRAVPSLPNPTTHKGWPHHRGLQHLLFSNSDVGSFTSHKNKSVKVLWDRTYGFSSLSEKTRKSNHLQMSLQRQHFLLSYLKTLSVGPARVWTGDLPLGRPALSQLS